MLLPAFDIKNSRYERKFQISDMQVAAIHQQIKNHPASFAPIFYPRYVNNIYLDNPSFEAFFDNVSGTGRRVKARIRWYGELSGLMAQPILEFKIKEGLLGNKLSFPLESFSLNENFSSDVLRNVFTRSKLPAWALETVLKQQPSLINRYLRSYYLSFDGKFRLTLDEDLTYYGVHNAPFYLLEKYGDSDYIVELKYAFADQPASVDVTDYLPFRLTKSSKYVNGMMLLHPQLV
jgi:hypothetical protein